MPKTDDGAFGKKSLRLKTKTDVVSIFRVIFYFVVVLVDYPVKGRPEDLVLIIVFLSLIR